MITNTKPQITGIILAGGKSSRMGQEKGLVLHQGVSFIQHIIEAVQQITDTIIISTANPNYMQFGYPCVTDSIPDCGPVGGIYTGLCHSKTAQNLVLSCDIPLITSETLKHLIQCHRDEYQVTYYENTPLIGCYNTTVTTRFKEHLQQKRLRLQQVLASVVSQTITIPKHIQYTIQNINTPTEYKKAMLCN